MPERWVVNASPLIVLAKINYQYLLSQLADEVVLPQAVLTEINAGPENDAARQFLHTSPFPIVTLVADPLITAWDLGAGESAVLTYALHNPDWKAVLDDGAARRCAHTLSIPLLGTLGIILRARQSNFIPAAAPVLKALINQGFRLDDDLIRAVLAKTVQETWP
jgi:predicted nucleic acid-binding protein